MPKESNATPCAGKQMLEPHSEQELSVLGSSGFKSRTVNSSHYAVITAMSSIRLSLEYPFWAMRVSMQSDPTLNSSITKTMKNIYTNKGFKGFYPGAGPYFLSLLCKQTYRLPAISLLPEYFKSWVPETWESHYGLPHIAAVSSLAIAETLVFGPIERVVRYRMVSNQISKLSFRFLYTGTGIGLTQNLLTWNMFTGLENFGQMQAKKLVKKDTLNTQETFGVGLFVGVSMTIMMQPIDALQTFAQTRPTEDKKPLLTAFGNHIKKHGIPKACFAGTKVALIQGIIGASTTVFALEALRGSKTEREETEFKKPAYS
jgi:hypothetical protein